MKTLTGAALLALAGTAIAAGPALADAGGRIAFVSTRDGNKEIYSMNPDGSDQQRLTETPGDEFDPALSPDGRRIAFSRLAGANRDIWVMNADGSGQTQFTTNAHSDRYPTWSPDGTRIAFRSNRSRGFDIWLVRLADGTKTRLTDEPGLDSEPTWSSGDLIAYAGDVHGSADIFVTAPGQEVPVDVTVGGGTDRYPSFSPDGRQLAFLSYGAVARGIYTMNVDGTGRAMVSPGDTESHPTWAPDGARIAFDRPVAGSAQIAVMGSDGSGLETVTRGSVNYQPSWGPDASLPIEPPLVPAAPAVPPVQIRLTTRSRQRGWAQRGGGVVVRARTDQTVPLSVKAYFGVRIDHLMIRTTIHSFRMTANSPRNLTLGLPVGARRLVKDVLTRKPRVRVAFSVAALNSEGRLTRAKIATFLVR